MKPLTAANYRKITEKHLQVVGRGMLLGLLITWSLSLNFIIAVKRFCVDYQQHFLRCGDSRTQRHLPYH